MNNDIEIRKLQLGPFATNAYIIVSRDTSDSILVDAPDEPAALLKALEGTHPHFIVITHNHPDHTGALKEMKSTLNVPVAIHPFDAAALPVKADIMLNNTDYVNFGPARASVIHTPGHTPGSICLKIGNALISGDTIFPGGPGHTDTPYDFKAIIGSLVSRIFVLPDSTEIFPGHGEATGLSTEKEQFAAFNSRPHSEGLCGDILWLSS
jgi:hydroxyacylglutathione hydrolase